jgi:hypothetical protein
MARYALGRQGVAPASVKSFVARATPGDLTGTIGLEVRSAGGEKLIESWRSFGPGRIELENIRIAESLRGKGMGGFLRRSEAAIFQRMGFKEGAEVLSPVMNPITARIHLQTYGGMLQTETAGGLYGELYGAKVPSNLSELVLSKQITKKEFLDVTVGGALAVGRLPSSRALNKILAHDMRWGRSWVQRTLGTDFMPGASWIGQAVKRGISWGQIGKVVARDPKSAS